MRSDHTFHVARPVEETWRRLTDLSPIADSATGGTYRVTLDGHSYRASFLERDEIDHRLVLTARTDPGSTRATITASLHRAGGGTRVDLSVDLTGATPPGPSISDLLTRLTHPPEATHAPAPSGAPPLRRAAIPAALAVLTGIAWYLTRRRRHR